MSRSPCLPASPATAYSARAFPASRIKKPSCRFPASATPQAPFCFDDTNNMVTGVAIVNIGSASTVNAAAYDMNGNIIGTATIPLAPDGKTAAALQSLLPATAGVLGSVDFTVLTGSVAALGLRFNGTSFTSIPGSER